VPATSPSPEKLNLEALLLPNPRHDFLPTAIQDHNHILEPTSTQPRTIDNIHTTITTADITSNRPYPTSPARRIAFTARDHNERLGERGGRTAPHHRRQEYGDGTSTAEPNPKRAPALQVMAQEVSQDARQVRRRAGGEQDAVQTGAQAGWNREEIERGA